MTFIQITYMKESPGTTTNKILRCAHNGIDFYGADLIYLVTDRNNVGKCEGFCREEELCVAFTYRPSNGQCWLKYRQYGAIGPTHWFDLVSMNMNCSK